MNWPLVLLLTVKATTVDLGLPVLKSCSAESACQGSMTWWMLHHVTSTSQKTNLEPSLFKTISNHSNSMQLCICFCFQCSLNIQGTSQALFSHDQLWSPRGPPRGGVDSCPRQQNADTSPAPLECTLGNGLP